MNTSTYHKTRANEIYNTKIVGALNSLGDGLLLEFLPFLKIDISTIEIDGNDAFYRSLAGLEELRIKKQFELWKKKDNGGLSYLEGELYKFLDGPLNEYTGQLYDFFSSLSRQKFVEATQDL